MLLKRLTNRYLGSITILASGSIIGQVIGFVGSMFMTRLYSQEEIGVMTTVVSVSGIFAAVINGRFDFGIVNEGDNQRVFPLIALSLSIGFFLSLIVSFGSVIYFANVEDLLIRPILAAGFVFIILWITSVTNTIRSYNNRLGDYKTMTIVIVMRRLAEELSMILFSFFPWKSIGLLISRVIGQLFGMRFQARNILKDIPTILHSKYTDILEAFSHHKRQLYYNAPATLLNSASYYLISLIIGQLYGLKVLGVYSISFAVLGLPLSVISANISKVYFAEASSESQKYGSFSICTNKTLKVLLPLSIIMWLGMYFLLPILVPIVYGEQYVIAGDYIRVLALMFTIRFVVSSLNVGLIVANKQNVEMIIQFLFLAVVAGSSLVCRMTDISIHRYLYCINLFFSIIYLIDLFFVIRYSKHNSLRGNA